MGRASRFTDEQKMEIAETLEAGDLLRDKAIIPEHREYGDETYNASRKLVRQVDNNIEKMMPNSAGARSLDLQEDIMCTGRILVVDDDEQCRIVISLLLESMGLEVDTASDGDEAVTKVTDEYFDLILMDVWMPGMNGCDAAMQIRNEGLTTPMFAITADAGDDTSEKCMASGFNGVIAKPADKKKLYEIVSRHLPVSAIDIE